MYQNHAVALRVLQAFAIGLGYPEDYFLREMDPHDPANLTTMVTSPSRLWLACYGAAAASLCQQSYRELMDGCHAEQQLL